MLKTSVLIFHPQASLDEEMLFDKITQLYAQTIRKDACKGLALESRISVSFLVRDLCGIVVYVTCSRC